MDNKSGKIVKKKADCDSASENRINATNNAKQRIDDVQNYLLSTEAAIDNQNLVKAIVFTENSKNQLNRNENTLTKADLIAIVIALVPKYSSTIDMLESHTIKDLNTLIRTIIYDPMRYISVLNESTSKNETVSSTKKKGVVKNERGVFIENEVATISKKKGSNKNEIPLLTNEVATISKKKGANNNDILLLTNEVIPSTKKKGSSSALVVVNK